MENTAPTLEGLQAQIAELQQRFDTFESNQPEDKLSMIVFSGDLDKALAAFIIATGAVAMGTEVVMFFTFWGTPLLRDRNRKSGGKDMMGTMFGAMLPTGVNDAKLSKMNMAGMGTAMMKSLMTKKHVSSLEELIDVAGELGVRIVICEMSMDLMGFKREEMIDYPHLSYGGVAAFLAEAGASRVQLFL